MNGHRKHSRKKWSFGILSIILLLLAPQPLTEGKAIGEDIANAEPIVFNFTTGSMPGPGTGGDMWFEKTLEYPSPPFGGASDGEFDFYLTPLGGDFDLYIYDENGVFLDSSLAAGLSQDIVRIYDDDAFIFGESGPYVKDYFIRVVPYSGATGYFSLQIINRGVIGPDPGAEPESAIVISPGTHSGSLDGNKWYGIPLYEDNHSITLSGEISTNFNLIVYDITLQSIASATSSTYPELLSLQMLPPGSYFIYIYGGTGSYSLTIHEANPPKLEIFSPTNSTYAQDQVIMSYFVADGSITVYLDEGIVPNTNNSLIIDLTEGEHNLTFVAIDPAGNRVTKRVFFRIDTVSPTIEVLSPLARVYNQSTIPLIYQIADGVTTIYLDGLANTTALPSQSTNFSALSEGDHNLTITAQDSVGNVGSLTVIFTIDTTAPVIFLTSPANTTIIDSELWVNLTTNEETSWRGYSLDGLVNITLPDAMESIHLPSLSTGTHRIIVYATDLIGNTGSSGTIWFTIIPEIQSTIQSSTTDTTAESITSTSTTSSTSAASTPGFLSLFFLFALYLYALKRRK